jgi:hypothetical protein
VIETTNETNNTKKAPANWRDLPTIEVKVTEKECGKCKRVLPVANFWKMRTSKDGLQPACKDCQMGVEFGVYTGKTKIHVEKPAKKEKPTPVVAAPDTPKEVTKQVSQKEPAKSADKPKKERPSRAKPIGSGQRKECATCTYRVLSTAGGKCISEDAEKDAGNQSKTCPHHVQSKTAKKAAKKANK